MARHRFALHGIASNCIMLLRTARLRIERHGFVSLIMPWFCFVLLYIVRHDMASRPIASHYASCHGFVLHRFASRARPWLCFASRVMPWLCIVLQGMAWQDAIRHGGAWLGGM